MLILNYYKLLETMYMPLPWTSFKWMENGIMPFAQEWNTLYIGLHIDTHLNFMNI